MEITQSRDENFDSLVEHSVITWMNENQRMRREAHNIHVTELNSCLLMSAGDRLFETIFENLADVNMMFIGITLESAFVRHNVLENIFPSEIITKKIPRSNTILNGKIDIDTARRGIFEIKSKESFWGLVDADRHGIPQLASVEICGSPRIIGKAPATSHIDQVNYYIGMSIKGTSRQSHLLYFSRTAREGIAPFTMIYTAEEVRKIIKGMYERGLTYDEAITEAFQYTDLQTITKILNEKLIAEPSGLCAYCTYGGTLSNKYPYGRVNGLKNYCPAPLNERYGFSQVHTLVPNDIFYDIDLRDTMFNKIINVLDGYYGPKKDKKTVYFKFQLLFDCPRMARYFFDNFPAVYGIGLSQPGLFKDTTAESAIKFNRLAIVEQLNSILNPSQDFQRVEFEYTPKLSSVFKPEPGVTYKFVQDYPIIDGYPTLIIPSATIKSTKTENRPPHKTDLRHIITAQLLSGKDFRLCYYPIKGAEVATYSLGVNGPVDMDALTKELGKRAEAIFDGQYGIPDPNIWCLWCAIWHIPDENNVSRCPYGKKWVDQFFEVAKKAKAKTKGFYVVNTEELVTKDEPYPYLDDMGRF